MPQSINCRMIKRLKHGQVDYIVKCLPRSSFVNLGIAVQVKYNIK